MTNFKELVLAGYQGWFAIPTNKNLDRWSHWCKATGKDPAPNYTAFELYPEVSEYPQNALHKTGYTPLSNGKDAVLFDSDCADVLDVHFRWMKEYHIDGAALQRFIGSLKGKNGEWRNSTALKLKDAAQKYERMFYIMYDISGHKAENLEEDIFEDYETFVKKNLFDSTSYCRQDNKPVIALWGLGFNDRPGNPQKTLQLIQKLKADNCYVVGGVPYRWRDGIGDAKAGWLDVFAQYDMLVPWAVGRYRTIEEMEGHVETIWKPDAQFCQKRNIDMQRVIFPGFAWSNLKNHQGVSSDRQLSRHSQDQVAEAPPNEIPRHGGKFFWAQALKIAELGLGAYIAMFDEYDEATAIAKAAPNKDRIPTNQYFLTLEDDGTTLSSDFYLRLAAEATGMIRAKTPGNTDVPIDSIGYHFYIRGGYRAILGRDADIGGLESYLKLFNEQFPQDKSGTVRRLCRSLSDNEEYRGRLQSKTANGVLDDLLTEWGRTVSEQERKTLTECIEGGEMAELAYQMLFDSSYIRSHI